MPFGFFDQDFQIRLAETMHQFPRFSCNVRLRIGMKDALDVDLGKLRCRQENRRLPSSYYRRVKLVQFLPRVLASGHNIDFIVAKMPGL